MGFKDWFNAQNERNRKWKESEAQRREGQQSERTAPRTFAYGVHRVSNGEYVYLPKGQIKSVRKPVAGASAEFESGASHSSATAGRVIAGALIAGPAGAIVGGMFRKQKGRCYVYVTFSDGDVAVVDGPIRDEPKLREFAQKINTAASHPAE